MDNREQIDKLIATTEKCNKNIIPTKLLNNLVICYNFKSNQ